MSKQEYPKEVGSYTRTRVHPHSFVDKRIIGITTKYGVGFKRSFTFEGGGMVIHKKRSGYMVYHYLPVNRSDQYFYREQMDYIPFSDVLSIEHE